MRTKHKRFAIKYTTQNDFEDVLYPKKMHRVFIIYHKLAFEATHLSFLKQKRDTSTKKSI